MTITDKEKSELIDYINKYSDFFNLKQIFIYNKVSYNATMQALYGNRKLANISYLKLLIFFKEFGFKPSK